MKESLTEACLRGSIHCFATLDPEVERPEEFRDADKEISFCQVDSWLVED